MVEVTEGFVLLASAPVKTLELPGATVQTRPMITVRALPGLRWLWLLLVSALDVRCEVALSVRPGRPAAGFTYDQVMSRSPDGPLPKALAKT